MYIENIYEVSQPMLVKLSLDHELKLRAYMLYYIQEDPDASIFVYNTAFKQIEHRAVAEFAADAQLTGRGCLWFRSILDDGSVAVLELHPRFRLEEVKAMVERITNGEYQQCESSKAQTTSLWGGLVLHSEA